MKHFKIYAFGLALLSSLTLPGCRPPDPVDYVDLDRYLGTWYEIASFPQSFQRDCVGTTATYEPHPNREGEILVTNACYKGSFDGELDVQQARAVVVDPEKNSVFKVYFSFFPGQYRIIALDAPPEGEPYRWAVVGSSTMGFLWILSRQPTLDDAVLDGILERLEGWGYDLDNLNFTEQPLDA